MSTPPARRWIVHPYYALAAALVFGVEVWIATQAAHITWVRAYLGDYLVVVLLYCLIKAVWPRPSRCVALGVFVFSAGIEGLQYLQLADTLGLAPGGLARTLLGSTFSWLDMLMYALGALTVWCLDERRRP